ncbi:MAG: LPS assembly lipoprotein LptE [Halothiobacillaceae bacterium]
MQRRTVLLALLTTGLSACGFQPRGNTELPSAMRRISLQGSQPSGLTQALERLLRDNGAEIVSTPTADTLHIRLTNVSLQRREALIDRQANVRQIELIQRAQLDVQRINGTPLIEHETFEAVRSTSYNPISILAQGEEEQRMRLELDEHMAQTMLARIRSRLSTA